MVGALFSSFGDAKPRVNLHRHRHAVTALMLALDEILCDADGVRLV
jgi:hypothetical protein